MDTTGGTRETQLHVGGMSCGSCVRHVGQALRGVGGVTAVEVSLAEGRVAVRHAGETSAQDLVEALLAAGYRAAPAPATGEGPVVGGAQRTG